MNRYIDFENSNLIRQPYVRIEGTEYNVTPGQYEGNAVTAEQLNQIQDGVNNDFANYIVEEYNNAQTYKRGDYCLYNHKLYKCIEDINTIQEWNNTHWELSSIGDELTDNILQQTSDHASILELNRQALEQQEVDFTNSCTFNEEGFSRVHTQFIKKGKMCFIAYQGENKAHTIGEVIAILPSAYRPAKSQIYGVCTIGTSAYGLVAISSSGELTLFGSSANVSGRIYCNFSYYTG